MMQQNYYGINATVSTEITTIINRPLQSYICYCTYMVIVYTVHIIHVHRAQI